MDLRLLCKAGIDNYDIGEGEFGKDAIKSKLYSDKLKLIANGKQQLNCILEEYSGNPNEIKLCFIQVKFKFLVLRLNSFNYGWKVMASMFYKNQSILNSNNFSQNFKRLKTVCGWLVDVACTCVGTHVRLC